jgi:chromosome partitioning protein
MPPKVLAIANQKGGVGKTTTAISLTAALSHLGKRVLIIDLDPHCCASVHLRYYPDEQRLSICEIFTRPKEEWPELWKQIITSPEHDNLAFNVTPAGIQLSDLEMDLKDRVGKGAILKEALTLILPEYDYVVLDCPPHLGILLVNALVASDLLIVPIQTDFLALHGLKLLVDTVRLLNKALPQPLDYMALPTMYDARTNACERVLQLLHTKMDERVFKSVIGLDTKFREASAQGTVIHALDQDSRGAQAYNQLAEEILKL